MQEKSLIAVVGPTAIGKTRLALAIARHCDTEIISADSRQFYREMQIGTAVPSREELRAVKHHFIQHKSISETYTVGDFERDALQVLQTLYETKRRVVLAGGSGLYVKAVTDGLDNFPEIPPALRALLNRRWSEEGLESLQRELRDRDPGYYDRADMANPHRVIRALEVSISSGRPYSSFLKGKKPDRGFRTTMLEITAPRQVIYDRIDRRVDRMMEAGLLEEARALYAHRERIALQSVGYTELFDFMEGKCTLEEAVARIKMNTRRFAKRQLTWFRKQEGMIRVNCDSDPGEVMGKIEEHLRQP